MSDNISTPMHLGIILDGNRRWAKANKLPAIEGHRQGSEVFKTISLAAFDRGIEYVSAFVFSAENWARTQEEVSYLMKLVIKATEKYLTEFIKRGIRIVILGSREGLSSSVLASIEKTQKATEKNSEGTLALCFNYSGQQEIADAATKCMHDGKAPITPEDIEYNLYSSDIPALDLIVRTSGEQRLSGFMLWRAAYAELLFSEKLWPDFTVSDLDKALDEYASRQRRFGH